MELFNDDLFEWSDGNIRCQLAAYACAAQRHWNLQPLLAV